MAETVTSTLLPRAAKGGRLAVTITAATSLVLTLARPRVLTPKRSRSVWSAWRVNGEF